LLNRLDGSEIDTLVIVLSSDETKSSALKVIDAGSYDYFVKPIDTDVLRHLLERAIEKLHIQRENRILREEISRKRALGDLIGATDSMRHVFESIKRVARATTNVIIRGESGVGKELVAHALHQLSLRSEKRFVEVNCAAIPEELIESELFGHLKGSFTGAVEDKTGKFEEADGGTLFLDEIGDMSLRTQSKVLRVIEEQRFTPVGSAGSLTVDVRVVTATNKNLSEEIQKGNFREDLFYRLNVIPFYVPPLREHPEDIPALAGHFLAEFARAYGRRPKRLSEHALEAFLEYRWPGNVRELRNLIERLVIMVPGERIERRNLPPSLQHDRGRAKTASAGGGFFSLQEARAAYERDYILRKLEENRGNISRTAEALGLERSHLYRKMKSLGIAMGEMKTP
jgi:two-component system, NtrC family, nitrogen regulation response regulator NtrX